jgi:hypothetical protein
MEKSLTDSRAKLLELMLQFLWRQWSALGVAGVAGVGQTGDDRLIDPEALLLATTVFGRYEARLFDEALDWLLRNGRRINLQRLRNLDSMWGVADRGVLAAIAEVLGDRSALRKWAGLQPPTEGVQDAEPQALFRQIDGSAMPVFGEPDALFLRWHLLRGPLHSRGMSLAPSPDTPATFLFKLRALFGVTARADILAWMLSHESGHPAEVARRVGYFSKTAQLVLNEMEESGHIHSRRSDREKHFWLRPEEWRFLLTWKDATSFPRWMDWAPLFSALKTLFSALSQPGLDAYSPALQAIHLREALQKALPALGEAGLAPSLKVSRQHRGAEMVETLLEDVARLIG